MKFKQCPKCYTTATITSLYCSQCATKLRIVDSDSKFPGKSNFNKSLTVIGGFISFAVLFLALLLFGIAAFLNKPRSAVSKATDSITSLRTRPALSAETISNVPKTLTLSGKVVGVTDGDTITVLDEKNVQHKIRLAGIDAPESSQDFGQKSKQNLSDLVYGKNVLILYTKTDKYGRIVGKVFLDGQDINLEQIKAGLAWHYKEYQNEQTDEDRESYAQAEVSAKDNSDGLWSVENPTPPWDWRKGTDATAFDAAKIYGNKNSFIYHWLGCPGLTKIAEKNRVVFDSVEEAESAGYRAAKNCASSPPKHELEEIEFESASSSPVYTTPEPTPYSTPYRSSVADEAASPNFTYTVPAATPYPTPRSYQRDPDTAAASPTAICADGSYSYSQNNRGTCSHHGGVSVWLNGTTNTYDSPPSYSPPRRTDSSSDSYRPKTVHVRGYTRKDGTYVAPHTRSAPRRRN